MIPIIPDQTWTKSFWEEFSRVYVTASKLILDRNPDTNPMMMSLPQRFLSKVAEMIQENEGWDPEVNIVFGD